MVNLRANRSDRSAVGQRARARGLVRASALVYIIFVGVPVVAAADLAQQAQAILARHCYDCHGPEKQKAELRLDADHARLIGGPTAVIAPGRAEGSELYRRITLPPHDEEIMPNRGDPLTKAQIAILRDWINQGAIWPEKTAPAKHWSYVAPVRPALPKVANAAWPRNAIDHFVLARLEQEKLRPSAEAEPARLLRRVYLDLTGLPPAPQEVAAFVADRSPDAYEQAVDRLLASPHYGERWARPWLDLARYADSYGFQRDDLWEVWPYRDWVIKAMNADLPFDQFTIEQLAGDLLPNATLEQKIATGFSRCGPINMETGSDQEETRVNQIFDRVNTMSTVWLGSTLECAQCHNHKYDPFRQKDYYQLFAFFNNTPQETAFSSPKATAQLKFLGPDLQLPDEKISAERAARQEELAKVDAAMTTLRAELTAGQPAWEETLRAQIAAGPRTHVLDVADFEAESGSVFKVLDDKSVQIVASDNAAVAAKDAYTLTVRANLAGITGFKLEVLGDPAAVADAEEGPPRKPDFVLTDFTMRLVANGGPGVPVKFRAARANVAQRLNPAAGAIDSDATTGWSSPPAAIEDPWLIVETAAPVDAGDSATLSITLRQDFGEARTIGRLRLSAITGDVQAISFPEDIVAIVGTPAAQRKPAQETRLADLYLSTSAGWKKLLAERKKIDDALKRLQPPSTLAMQELEQPRMSAMFVRGNFMEKGEPVQPAVPDFLHPIKTPPASRPNRLDLAQWLVSPENPLVARVTVNRWWAEIFGHGLVTTPEDFGLKGELPTHPELLDWLAVEFMARGWSMKQVHRLIVTSATYRQSSSVTPELLRIDDRNTLYARGPRFRMEAEMIRDNALAVAGLLSPKLGGPPVKPYQPAGLWESKVGGLRVAYNVSEGEDRHRRGLYTVWKRTSPYPSFINFDATNRTACTVSRPRSNTPLQALTLLNDPVYVEAAMALARRTLAEKPAGSVTERIRHAFQLCLARAPADREVQTLTRLYDQQLAASRESVTRGDSAPKAKAPRKATKSIESPKSPDIDPAEFAAWQSVAAALLNLDETITKG
jgi:mono/diheme cytochrome c family protein